jgi:hypothetical protein
MGKFQEVLDECNLGNLSAALIVRAELISNILHPLCWRVEESLPVTRKSALCQLSRPVRSFCQERQVRAFAYMLRVYAGETPECDAGTAAFVAGIVRGMGRDTAHARHDEGRAETPGRLRRPSTAFALGCGHFAHQLVLP